MSDSNDPVDRPHDWQKVLRAAAAWIVEGKHNKAARAGGVDVRTLRRWKKCSWWPRAVDEAASGPWYTSMVIAARRALMQALEAGDGVLALRVLERVDTQLAPPAVTLRWKRDQVKELAGLTVEQLRDIEHMSDEEVEAWLQGGATGQMH